MGKKPGVGGGQGGGLAAELQAENLADMDYIQIDTKISSYLPASVHQSFVNLADQSVLQIDRMTTNLDVLPADELKERLGTTAFDEMNQSSVISGSFVGYVDG